MFAPGHRCPFCGSHRCELDGPRNYKCTDCGAVHDDAPHEGGDYSHDPTRRIQQQETRRKRIGGKTYDRYGKQP